MRDDEGEDHLPIELGPVSNGEYDPVPMSAVGRETVSRTREAVDDHARRLGMSRRSFLRTSMASAVMLMALDACSGEERASRGKPPGGQLNVPEPTTTEPTLPSTDFVMDVQTHFLDFTEHPDAIAFGDGFPQAACGDADSRLCFSIDHYLEEVFLRSDTSIAVVSALPIAPEGNALLIEDMERARSIAERLCAEERVLIHGQALPAFGPLDAQLAAMDALVAEHSIAAWKVYTHAPGRGWYLDDHEAAQPQVGNAFLDKVREVGPPIVSVHKGLAQGSRYASPEDIGPAAAAHPDVSFVVYHSGYQTSYREGPYNPDGPGVDRFVRSLRDAGIGPGANVYAELGSTWYLLMRDLDAAAHALGKLLVTVGPDRVVWGTDSIWYGSPQSQIDAFRAFEITPEYQETYGYPALTDDVKRKILGANAAALYDVEPVSTSCEFSPDDIAAARQPPPPPRASNGPPTAQPVRTLARDHGWVGF
ncbi:MAG: amidohydrolase family protein [Acidimicrobiia bacterium]